MIIIININITMGRIQEYVIMSIVLVNLTWSFGLSSFTISMIIIININITMGRIQVYIIMSIVQVILSCVDFGPDTIICYKYDNNN